MATSTLLSVADTFNNSADFTVVAGTPATLFLTTTAGGDVNDDVQVNLQIKGALGQYINVARLGAETGIDGSQGTATQVAAPGTYRVQRTPTGIPVGVDQA